MDNNRRDFLKIIAAGTAAAALLAYAQQPKKRKGRQLTSANGSAALARI